MGGRANAGNTKLFSNIDATRNAPLRATRAKQIEEGHAPKAIVKLDSDGFVRNSSGKLIGKIRKVAGQYQADVNRDYSLSVSSKDMNSRHDTQKAALAHFEKLAPTLKQN